MCAEAGKARRAARVCAAEHPPMAASGRHIEKGKRGYGRGEVAKVAKCRR